MHNGETPSAPAPDAGAYMEYRRRKKELSPASIKEATDKLPMGICFADPDGRLILCNDIELVGLRCVGCRNSVCYHVAGK